MNHSEPLFLAKKAEIQHYFFYYRFTASQATPGSGLKEAATTSLACRNHIRQLPESHNRVHYALTFQHWLLQVRVSFLENQFLAPINVSRNYQSRKLSELLGSCIGLFCHYTLTSNVLNCMQAFRYNVRITLCLSSNGGLNAFILICKTFPK